MEHTDVDYRFRFPTPQQQRLGNVFIEITVAGQRLGLSPVAMYIAREAIMTAAQNQVQQLLELDQRRQMALETKMLGILGTMEPVVRERLYDRTRKELSAIYSIYPGRPVTDEDMEARVREIILQQHPEIEESQAFNDLKREEGERFWKELPAVHENYQDTTALVLGKMYGIRGRED